MPISVANSVTNPTKSQTSEYLRRSLKKVARGEAKRNPGTIYFSYQFTPDGETEGRRNGSVDPQGEHGFCYTRGAPLHLTPRRFL